MPSFLNREDFMMSISFKIDNVFAVLDEILRSPCRIHRSSIVKRSGKSYSSICKAISFLENIDLISQRTVSTGKKGRTPLACAVRRDRIFVAFIVKNRSLEVFCSGICSDIAHIAKYEIDDIFSTPGEQIKNLMCKALGAIDYSLAPRVLAVAVFSDEQKYLDELKKNIKFLSSELGCGYFFKSKYSIPCEIFDDLRKRYIKQRFKELKASSNTLSEDKPH
jgi:hypothetical protein